MNLSPRARALLDRARPGFEPDAEASMRNEKAVLSTLGIAAATTACTAATGAAAGKAAGGAGVGWLGAFGKIVAILLVVTTAGGVIAASRRSGVDSPAVPAMPAMPAMPRVVVAPPAVSLDAPATVTSASASLAVSAPIPKARVARPMPTPKPSATPQSSSLGDELLLVRQGAALLAVSRPADALVKFDEHARRFPGGVLVEERESGRIRALCALGRSAEASDAAARFVSTNPASPYVASVRASCAFAR